MSVKLPEDMLSHNDDKNTPEISVEYERLNDQLGYTPFDNAVMMSPVLSVQARFLYAVIKRFASMGQAIPGRETLAEIMSGAHPNTVDRYLKELVEFGLLEKVRRGAKKTNKYILKDLNNDMIHKLNPLIKKYRDLQSGVNHESDSQPDVNHESDSQSVVTHDSQPDVNHNQGDSQPDVNNKKRAGKHKYRGEERKSRQAGTPALHTHPEYKVMVERYGAEVIEKAFALYINDVNEGRKAPKSLLAFFFRIVEEDYIPRLVLIADNEKLPKSIKHEHDEAKSPITSLPDLDKEGYYSQYPHIFGNSSPAVQQPQQPEKSPVEKIREKIETANRLLNEEKNKRYPNFTLIGSLERELDKLYKQLEEATQDVVAS